MIIKSKFYRSSIISHVSLLLIFTFVIFSNIVKAQINYGYTENGYNHMDSYSIHQYSQLRTELNNRLSSQYRLDNNLPENFPSIIIANKNKPTGGIYFLNSRLSAGNFMICIDTCGTPVFFREMSGLSGDFRLHPNGYLAQFEEERSRFVQYDSSYNEMRTYASTSGLITDSHDLLIEDDGSYWLIGKRVQIVDMSLIVPGGNPTAYVIENIIQHIDIPGNILFQWNSLDHIDILDCDTSFVNLTGNYIDYIHINALDLDTDGNLLISSRHLNEITKIDISNGDIIWRWGGNNNQFTFINDDVGFSGQHSIRSQGNGLYTLFDNGNWHTPPHSRGLEYLLDENMLEATLIEEFFTGDSLNYSSSMGHMQKTEDQGTILGMSVNNQGFVLSDFNSSGEKVLDMMNFEGTLFSYRASKNSWKTNLFYFTNDTITLDYNTSNDTTAIAIIYNNSDETIELSGYHTNNPVFYVSDNFPVEIPANSSREFTITFTATSGSYFTDALTIYSNSNNDSLRIAAQTRLEANITTSISDNELSSKGLNIIPNPLITKSVISLINNKVIERVRVINLNGKVLKDLDNINNSSVILNRNDLPSGIHIVEVQTKSEVFVGKLVVK